jgi:hypothetical protein
MSKSTALLKRFIPEGGLTGRIAGMYVHDQQQSAKFLFELKEQLKTNKRRFERNLGHELIRELEQFS